MNISRRSFLINLNFFFFISFLLISNKEEDKEKENYFIKKRDLKKQVWLLSSNDC